MIARKRYSIYNDIAAIGMHANAHFERKRVVQIPKTTTSVEDIKSRGVSIMKEGIRLTKGLAIICWEHGFPYVVRGLAVVAGRMSRAFCSIQSWLENTDSYHQ